MFTFEAVGDIPRKVRPTILLSEDRGGALKTCYTVSSAPCETFYTATVLRVLPRNSDEQLIIGPRQLH